MRTLHTHVRQGRAQKERPEHAPLEGREDGCASAVVPGGARGIFWEAQGSGQQQTRSRRMRMQHTHTPGRDTSAPKVAEGEAGHVGSKRSLKDRQGHVGPKRSLKESQEFAGSKGRTQGSCATAVVPGGPGDFWVALGSGQQQLHAACSTRTMRTMQVAPGNKLRAELP